MAWIYSPELVESVSLCSHGLGPCVMSKSSHFRKECCKSKSTPETLTTARSGTMSEHSTPNPGLVPWISSVADSPARISAQRERGRDWTESEAFFSGKSSGLLAKFDHNSFSWKTSQLLLLKPREAQQWLGPLPAWGMIVDGECYQLPTLAHRTKENVGGYWPTPTVTGNHNRKGASLTSADGLETAVKKFPTPLASDAEKVGQGNLTDFVRQEAKRYPTPTAMDAAGFCGKPDKGRTGPNSGRTLTGKVLEMEGQGPHAVRYPTPMNHRGDLDGGSNSRQAFRERETPQKDQMEMFPTPSAAAAIQGVNQPDGKRGQTLLGAAQGQKWPTPTASDGEKSGEIYGKGDLKLSGAVKKFPTPTARDHKSGKASQAPMERNARPLSEVIGGSLNPPWVEWLMGYPIGWTGLRGLEILSFRFVGGKSSRY